MMTMIMVVVMVVVDAGHVPAWSSQRLYYNTVCAQSQSKAQSQAQSQLQFPSARAPWHDDAAVRQSAVCGPPSPVSQSRTCRPSAHCQSVRPWMSVHLPSHAVCAVEAPGLRAPRVRLYQVRTRQPVGVTAFSRAPTCSACATIAAHEAMARPLAHCSPLPPVTR